jgi:hypothetical protein
MAWEFAYRCDRCRRVQRVRTGDFRFYVLPWQDESLDLFARVSCRDKEGWCRRCRRLRPVESLPDIALLERMREGMTQTRLPDPDRELAAEEGRSEQEEIQRQLGWIDERIRWRKERVSPAKCFACGSTEVEPLEVSEDGKGFRHPGCGGTFRICETPCHIQPSMGYLIPSEGPEPWRPWRLLWRWLCRRKR